MGTYRTMGIMSGTSLDGVDLVLVDFSEQGNRWHTDIIAARSVPYPADWQERLPTLAAQPATVLAEWGVAWSLFVAKEVNQLLESTTDRPMLIGCHGHTVAHHPAAGWTLQLGDGPTLAVKTGIPVVNNFRQGDIAAGGQGAPLVPLGDLLLFPETRYCLNLGGIANISCKQGSGQIVGGDLTGCNTLLNSLAQEAGMPYDKDGILAVTGHVDPSLLQELWAWDFLHRPIPKSLDTADVHAHQLAVLQQSTLTTADKAATVCAFISQVVDRFIRQQPLAPSDQLLITGGGCHHPVLTQRIQEAVPCQVIIPESVWIDQKEAIIFAFLGLRRWLGQTTTLATVTGADRDTISGSIHLP